MMLVVSGVGFLILSYAVGYMKGDDEERRYHAYKALFVFSMLLLVQAGNLLFLLAGWGMVGLSSYLLINFWHQRTSAVQAGKKAFIMNAFGDATFAIALFLLIQQTGHARFLLARGRVTGPARSLADTGDDHRARPPRGSRREVGPGAAPHVASGCDGGPDAGLRPHPRGDDGDRRGLPHRTHRIPLRAGAGRAAHGRRARRRDPARRGPHRARADGYQARDRLLHHEPDRLHVRRRGARRLRRRDVPPHDARLLQGAALHDGGGRHPRALRRAGHPQDGRARPRAAPHGAGVPDRHAVARRDPAVRGLLLEGRDPRERSRRRNARRDPLRDGDRRLVPDGRLLLPIAVRRLPGQEVRATSSTTCTKSASKGLWR